jgi:hypothetical protein
LARSHLHKAQTPEDEALARRIGDSIEEALRNLSAGALSDEALAALRRGNADQFLQGLDWGAFGESMTDATLDPLAGVYLSRGLRAMDDLSRVTAVLDFELLEPRAIRWATQRAGQRVVQVGNDTRMAVRELVRGALADRVDVMTTARLIRNIIPLHDRFAAAVERTYQRTLEAQIRAGATAEQAAQRAAAAADRQAARLLRVRSENIARTEIMSASNAGRFEGWAVEIAQGNASPNSRKEWTVGFEACPECDPSEGEVVRWDEPFSNGVMMPPLHPSCRCTGVLLPPDEELRGPKEPKEAAARSNPDAPGTGRPGSSPATLTNEQGERIAASYRAAVAGRKTMQEHRELFAEITNTKEAA